MKTSVCPTSQRLAEYSAGCLDERSSVELEAHLDTCVSCHDTLIVLERNPGDQLLSELRQLRADDGYAGEPEMAEALALAEEVASNSSCVEDEGPRPASFVSPMKPGPQIIRDYQLVEKLGEGGMGAVYRALHTQLGKFVAIKLIPAFSTTSGDAVARFRREAIAHGQLDHPHLVRATDAGCEAGTWFLVMDLVEGLDLQQLVGRCGPLPLADACEIIRQAALGLEYAHSKGVIHRDVKPSNIMLSLEGRVKVLDLGLAKQRSVPADELTSHGQIMGTLDYMSPEQGGDTRRVDHRADIYSLGCTLYFLLAGEPPYRHCGNSGPGAKLLSHAQQPIPSILTTRPTIPASFDALLQQMLAKSPDARTASAADVAAALSRYTNGFDLVALAARAIDVDPNKTVLVPQHETTTVCSSANIEETDSEIRPTLTNHQSRLSTSGSTLARGSHQRPLSRRAAAAGLAAIATVFFGLIVIATGEGTLELKLQEKDVTVKIDGDDVSVELHGTEPVQIRRPAGSHELRVSRGDELLYTRQFRLFRFGKRVIEANWNSSATSNGPIVSSDASRNPETVGEAIRPGNSWPWVASAPLVSNPGKIDGIDEWNLETRNLRADLRDLAFSPNGKYLAAYSQEGAVRLWETESWKLVNILRGKNPAHDHVGADQIAWSPDSHWLATAGHLQDSNVLIWNVASGSCVRVIPLQGPTTAIAWSPDGKLLAADVPTANSVVLLETASWLAAKSLPSEGIIYRLAWSPDSSKLAAGHFRSGLVELWNISSGSAQVIKLQPERPKHSHAVAFAPDGRQFVATSDESNSIAVIDAADGKIIRSRDLEGSIADCDWLHESNQLVVCGSSYCAALDPHSLDVKSRFNIPGDQLAVSISPSTRQLVVGAEDGGIRVVDPSSGVIVHSVSVPYATLSGASWSPDGELLAIAEFERYRKTQPVRVWSIEKQQAILRTHLIPTQTYSVMVSPGGDSVWSVDRAAINRWQRGMAEASLSLPVSADAAQCSAISPDQRRMMTGGGTADRSIRMWDTATGQKLYELPPFEGGLQRLSWSPDGRLVAIGMQDQPGLTVIRADDGKVEHQFSGDEVKQTLSIAWSSDSRRLAVGNDAMSVIAFDAATWTPIDRCEIQGRVRFLDWIADGDTVRIVEEHRDQFARLYDWTLSTGELRPLPSRPVVTASIAVSPTHQLGAGFGSDGAAYLWHIETGQRAGVLMSLPDNSTHWISPAGQLVSSSQAAAETGLVYVLRSGEGTELLFPGEFARSHGTLVFPVEPDAKVEVR